MPYSLVMSVRLLTLAKPSGVRSLAIRIGVVVGLIMATILIVYFEGGLRDTRTGGRPEFLDCVYFALITITTVGYGDIVPVETSSRLVDALLLTPIRFIVILVFLGTAYEMSIKRLQEGYRMKRAIGKLSGHVIVCGYGGTGRSAVQQLLQQGTPADQIVIMDPDEDALQSATDSGLVAVMGDATRESDLKEVAIQRAGFVLICTGRDDSGILVALTIGNLNPSCKLVAKCHEEENVKLLQRSGAHTIVSPASAGGTLMAASTRHSNLVETMQDLMDVGGTIQLLERGVADAEVGKLPAELPGAVVLRVYRGDQKFEVAEMDALQCGDSIIYVAT
jgi:voltage-gated potassium channel